MIIRILATLSFMLFLESNLFGINDVVINEFHYHPVDDAPTEFIELYNPTNTSIDLSGYAFTSGIAYSIPTGTVIPPDGYLLVVKDTRNLAWQGIPNVGPYSLKLSNRGEKVVLRAPNKRIVDGLIYSDDPPWPRAADGNGSSLERISPDLVAQDYHSWRASVNPGGTPGRKNSVFGTPPRPVITSFRIRPQHPTSNDNVQIQVYLDAPELIRQATLRVEASTTIATNAAFTLPMTSSKWNVNRAAFHAEIPAQPSQTLVRCGVEITFVDGKMLRLPHESELRPLEAYFVYDNEIPSLLPILWMFRPRTTNIPSQARNVSGAAIKPLGEEPVQVYDGARVINSRNGTKIKFLKGEEYQRNRTINIVPESPRKGTTAGPQSPHIEHLSYRIFRDFGVLAPQCDWYRLIDRGNHTQRIAFQQPNEQFLEINSRDRRGNIYKIAVREPGGYTKKTNVDEGDEDYRELFRHVNVNNRTDLPQALRRYLVIEEIMAYEVVVNLLNHWDGIKNNIFLYHNPHPIDKWEMIPWDIDKSFGYLDSDPMFWKIPIDFPKTGYVPGHKLGARELSSGRRSLIGPIGRPFHMDPELHQEYVRRLGEALDGLFSEERINGLILAVETLLLEDLELLEEYTGKNRNQRQDQIKNSYNTMRRFLRLRHEYLRSQLPTSFHGARILPSDSYEAGSTITGVKVTVALNKGYTTSLRVIENIPDRFTVTNIHTTSGDAALSGNTITWLPLMRK